MRILSAAQIIVLTKDPLAPRRTQSALVVESQSPSLKLSLNLSLCVSHLIVSQRLRSSAYNMEKDVIQMVRDAAKKMTGMIICSNRSVF